MSVYRKEIDGLRAIAVLSVILYHSNIVNYVSGGYVGVDIFFVISGYLITSIIEEECDKETFSIINFYERRCRRILPMLFIIICVTFILSYNNMLPGQLKELGETVVSIICFSSNTFFFWKDDGYFTEITRLNPLIHTWSLAVEEQFYFIFPFLCYLFRGKKNYRVIFLGFIAIISLFLAQWGGNLQILSINEFQVFSQHRYASFYLLPGRFWELLLGSFVAFYSRSNHATKYIVFLSDVLF